MLGFKRELSFSNVALLAEGVDRNTTITNGVSQALKSPSSRRAWIEIVFDVYPLMTFPSRPPRGGRG